MYEMFVMHFRTTVRKFENTVLPSYVHHNLYQLKKLRHICRITDALLALLASGGLLYNWYV